MFVRPLVVGLLGLIPLFNGAGNAAHAGVRGVDIVRLVAAGMCFGAAFTSFMFLLISRRSH